MGALGGASEEHVEPEDAAETDADIGCGVVLGRDIGIGIVGDVGFT